MDRHQTFQRLKQPCIQLLQATASLAHKPDARKALVAALAHLCDTLHSIAATPAALDAKLVEYAFVPISQVLRLSRQVPVRALELCLECISTLLDAAWGGALEPALSAQLLILFSFLAKPTSAENGIAASSEELQTLALRCMAQLLTETSRTIEGKEATTATSNIPALGDAVLVMLDTITDAKANATRLQAAIALQATIDAISDNDALASFLPRMVSSLTKTLTPGSSNRPSFRVVEQSLQVLSSLLLRLLSDRATKTLPDTTNEQAASEIRVLRSTSWLQATSSQIKVALANVFRLRDHDKPEVRWTLLQLCLGIVQDCRASLPDCIAMTIETAISLAGCGENQDAIETELKVLLSADHALADVLHESLHGWVVSLPRLMQSRDDNIRRQIIHQISVTLRLFNGDATFIDGRLADALRDGISTVLGNSKGLEVMSYQQPQETDHTLVLTSSTSLVFEPLSLRLKGQEDMMVEFRQLIHELAKSDSAVTVLQELMRTIDTGDREAQLASFWSALHLVQDITQANSIFDQFVDMGISNPREELLDALYSHSVTILTQRDDFAEMSCHFYALALETIALQAIRYQNEYRGELTDVLYPVLHCLGDPDENLRSHALTCLNILSDACGYADAGELVVANVDYIVNAVGLKLAVGDVSPQAPQVLLMMMRLCGPSLLPYLDDLVGSIFDALERYHGYPKLTELLFAVLKGMVEEGVKAPLLAITQGDEDERSGTRTKTVTMADIIRAVKTLNQGTKKIEENINDPNEPFPQEPWKKDATAPPASRDELQNESQDQDQPPAEPEPAEPPPPAPRIYDLLLRISELTQHYLTTSSPTLRTSLLSLLRTTIPALAKHENSFLPLIHTLWPVLLPRLEDPEAYVVSNALDILALMCEHAGDFMRSRIEDAWDIFVKVHGRTKQRSDGRAGTQQTLLPKPLNLSGVVTGMQKLAVHASTCPAPAFRPELYVDAPTRMIWNSLVALLCAIAGHVTLKNERFDHVLEILEPVMEREDVRSALEKCNADAVWLRMYLTGRNGLKENAAGGDAAKAMDRIPTGRTNWQFVVI
ncbi:HEAT repeat protein-like protein [Ampelomyces quisqualis]|uniref:HEAT repeat protein-like protein n=1 Tax=Ampelomyces quisqualis TaxID=50730 RepID=A0A6A5QSA9_AMPQU|nr:HEAT repeat protein-like protein [Ampelomyces quisqualis]